jgi:hypothetical protein
VILSAELEGKSDNLTNLTDLTSGSDLGTIVGRNDFNQDDGLEIPRFLRRTVTQ